MKEHELGVTAEKNNKTIYVGVQTMRTFGPNGIVVHEQYFQDTLNFLHTLEEQQCNQRLKSSRRIRVVELYEIRDLQKGWLRDHKIWSEAVVV